MIRLLDNTKFSLFNYFYIFCLFIYAGSATVFARDLGDIRTVGNAFALFLTLIFFKYNKVRLSKRFIYSILVFLLYAIVTSLNNQLINPFWISRWLIFLTIAYGLCQCLGEKLFVAIETVLFHLSIISLAFWIVHIVNPTLMENLAKTLAFSQPYAEDSNVKYNIIFYTINSDKGSDFVADFIVTKRNSGFTWEPGAFASFLCFGIFCNILRTDLNIKRNKAFWVFLLALFSSQSTTGFMTLIFMSGVWLIANRKYWWGVVILPISIALFSLPFVSDKMLAEFQYVSDMDYRTATGSTAFNRTYSLMLDWQEFLRHPLLGLGGWSKGTLYAQQGYEFATISGIGGLLSQYGAIMSILFFFLLIQSSRLIRFRMNKKNAYILIATMLGMMYSYGLWTTPIIITFWMFCVYAPPKRHYVITSL